jgi:hypothetical protein
MNKNSVLASCWILLLTITSGCVTYTPRPHRFVETTNSPESFTHFAGWSQGSTFYLDVVPRYYSPTFYGINAFKEGNDLYVYPFYESLLAFTIGVSSMRSKLNMQRESLQVGTNRVLRFTFDMKAYKMPDDWPSHVYWLMESGNYWFPGPRFWSEARREPAVRRQIEVRPLNY